MAQHDRYETYISKALESIACSLESIDEILKRNINIKKEEIADSNKQIDEKTGEKLAGCYIILVGSEKSRFQVYDYVRNYYCSPHITCQLSYFDKALVLFNNIEHKVQSTIYVRDENINKICGFRPKMYFFVDDCNNPANYNQRDKIKLYLGRDKETDNLDELLNLAFHNKLKEDKDASVSDLIEEDKEKLANELLVRTAEKIIEDVPDNEYLILTPSWASFADVYRKVRDSVYNHWEHNGIISVDYDKINNQILIRKRDISGNIMRIKGCAVINVKNAISYGINRPDKHDEDPKFYVDMWGSFKPFNNTFKEKQLKSVDELVDKIIKDL